MSGQRFDCDLAIVGAGFAGLSCAPSAALRGLKTIVVELAVAIFFHSRGGPAVRSELAEIDPELRAPVE